MAKQVPPAPKPTPAPIFKSGVKPTFAEDPKPAPPPKPEAPKATAVSTAIPIITDPTASKNVVSSPPKPTESILTGPIGAAPKTSARPELKAEPLIIEEPIIERQTADVKRGTIEVSDKGKPVFVPSTTTTANITVHVSPSPEEIAERNAIEAVAMQDAINDPNSDILPVTTKATKKTLRELYQDTEAQLLRECPMSHSVQVGRHTPIAFHPLEHQAQGINIIQGGRARHWSTVPEGVQAENAVHLSQMVREATEKGMRHSAQMAADVARAK